MLSDLYRRQAALLVRLLPLVAEEPCFVLKGGTAINFFVRDMPRLSVDIDLMYLPVEDRDSSLAEIESALNEQGLSTSSFAAFIDRHFQFAQAFDDRIEHRRFADEHAGANHVPEVLAQRGQYGVVWNQPELA